MVKLARTIFLILASGIFLVWIAKAAEPGTVSNRTLKPEGPPAGWKLIWNDEFDGKEIDPAKWDFDDGNFLQAGTEKIPGWGNGELEFYTRRRENVYLKDGMLHLRALRENYQACQFTSARLNSRNLFSKRYGRFDFRAKLPTGKGVWPAIWMRPQDEKYGGWAASGEIDLMEARGQEPEKVLGTLHYGSRWPANVHSEHDFIFPNKGTIGDFHVYSLEWKPGEIRWLVDDRVYQTQNFWWSCSDTNGPRGVEPVDASHLNSWPAPFDQPFYIILNVAIGGAFLGNPDADTKFPAEMVVDYIRVYDPIEGYPPAGPRGPGKFPFSK